MSEESDGAADVYAKISNREVSMCAVRINFLECTDLSREKAVGIAARGVCWK